MFSIEAQCQFCDHWRIEMARLDTIAVSDSVLLGLYSTISDSLDPKACPERASALYRRIGIIHLDQNNAPEALKMFKASTQWADQSHAPRYIAAAANMMGKYYSQTEDYDSSLHYFKSALGHYYEDSIPYDLILAYQNLAVTYYYSDQNDSARAYCYKMQDLAKKSGTETDVYTAGQILLLLGVDADGASQATIERFRDFLNVFSSQDDPESVFNIYENIGYSYELMQEYDSAIHYYTLASVLASTNGSLDQLNWMNSKITSLSAVVQQLNTNKSIWIVGLVALLLIISLVSYLYFRNRKHLATIKQERINTLLQQQELIAVESMLQGQENERKHIAEELHDRLGGTLAAAKLILSSNRTEGGTEDAPSKEQSERVQGLIDETAKEVRRIAQNLNSVVLEEYGLEAAFKQLGKVLTPLGTPKIQWFMENMPPRFNPVVELNVYRIVQEALGNALKHADAQTVTVQLLVTEQSMNLVIEDDGKGFDVDLHSRGSGLGLRNLESRVERLSGELNIDSVIGHGTSIIIDIPLKT